MLPRLTLTALLLALVVPAARAIEFTEDSLKEVKQAIDEKKAKLVDVRTKKEWDKGHVAGAIFLPVTSLTDELEEKELAKALPKKGNYYIHCAVGIRATRAAEYLEERGYEVKVLKLGYQQLIEAGFRKAEEKKPTQPPKPAPSN
ncbi:rhodanese-like domain-containing protein [Lacipirellula sp.]|uniref:rhodanese-like domain-containing protein n=1 Tax=Lacipirellula sp. TaxID=2691419 RepID=UPI003D0B1386